MPELLACCSISILQTNLDRRNMKQYATELCHYTTSECGQCLTLSLGHDFSSWSFENYYDCRSQSLQSMRSVDGWDEFQYRVDEEDFADRIKTMEGPPRTWIDWCEDGAQPQYCTTNICSYASYSNRCASLRNEDYPGWAVGREWWIRSLKIGMLWWGQGVEFLDSEYWPPIRRFDRAVLLRNLDSELCF